MSGTISCCPSASGLPSCGGWQPRSSWRNAAAKRYPRYRGRDVFIDGFNIVIMLEVLLSDSILFSCMDETVRDLSALRGTYRIIPETQGAVRLLLEALREMEVREKIVFIMRKR